jgi:N-acyl-D-aspartate/D-glutamate deacylase
MKRMMLLLAVAMLGGAAPPDRVDLIIRGGTIYTGSEAPFVGDVAVSGDRIHAVGQRLPHQASREIDAGGMIVAPGFIDPHTHLGAQLTGEDAQERLIPGFLMQGVTTAFIGNDGGGGPDVGAVLGSARTRPVGINYAAYVGFGGVREAVIGEADRAPTPDELARMRQMVAAAMCQGALGLSTGLFYAPQSFAETDEVVALAREAGNRGGVYDSHIRDESSYSIGLAAAVDEAMAVGREAGLPVNISHIKALGVDVHGRRSSNGSRRRAGLGSGSPPINIPGRLRARASPPLWCRAGRMTAVGPQCCSVSTMRAWRSACART